MQYHKLSMRSGDNISFNDYVYCHAGPAGQIHLFFQTTFVYKDEETLRKVNLFSKQCWKKNT